MTNTKDRQTGVAGLPILLRVLRRILHRKGDKEVITQCTDGKGKVTTDFWCCLNKYYIKMEMTSL